MIALKTIDANSLNTVFAGQGTADLSPMIQSGRTIRTKESRRRFTTARNTKRAMEQISKLPRPGESLHMVLQANAFACFDVMPAMLDLVGGPADEVILATLGISSRHIHALGELFAAKRIKRCSLLLSHYFSRVDKGEFAEAVELFARYGFPVKEARSHAKIIGVRFGNQNHLIFEASGNLRSCRAVEVGTICNDRRLYRWHRAWINEMLGATNAR